MSLYNKYLKQIIDREANGLNPLPIDSSELLGEIIGQIKDKNHKHRKDSLKFFI